MQFIPPFDQIGVTPPGPWTNAAPQAGVQGSIVNADVFPAVQNEILAIIAADPSLTPSASDLGQAQKSIAAQIGQVAPAATSLWHVGVDNSTSAAAITATAAPAVTTRAANLAYLIIPANACAGATTINVGFGLEPLTRSDGTALQSGDYLAHQPLVVIDDGTDFRIVDLTPSQIIALILANQQKIVASAPSLSPPKNGRLIQANGTYVLMVGGTGPNDPPATVTDVLATGVGAGGGGAGAGNYTSPAANWSGGGGGSGGPVSDWIRGLKPGDKITLVVGKGGAGGVSASGGSQGASGTSPTLTASPTNGAAVTLTATGGGGAAGNGTTCSGGPAGVGSGSSLGYNLYGAAGGDGNPSNINVQGGGGAASIFGGGGRTATLGSNNSTVSNGLAPGSGGGGIWLNNGNNQTGGVGADGGWFIQW